MATPHIEAEKEDIAKKVLMPGDPLRAKFIAETYLTDVTMFNQVRNMFGYTGYYNGKKVSVMGSGMGMPSIGIYSYELYKFFEVDEIIRIGSCGSLSPDIKLFDVVLGEASCSDSTFGYVQNGSTDKIISSSSTLLSEIEEIATKEGINIISGNIYSTDVFTPYQDAEPSNYIKTYNCIVAEMESFALFHTAKALGKKAACLLTVSDSPYVESNATPEQRETAFTTMVELALKTL